jgi:hypothetical protein
LGHSGKEENGIFIPEEKAEYEEKEEEGAK